MVQFPSIAESQSITTEFEKALEGFHSFRQLTIDCAELHSPFVEFVQDHQQLGKQQYLFACFALSDALHKSRDFRLELISKIMFQRRHELITALSGLPCDPTTLKVIEKFGPV